MTRSILLAAALCAAGAATAQDNSATFLQPFGSFTTPKATSFTLNTESTYDWENEAWSVPINATAGQIVKISGVPVQFTLGARYWAQSPEGGPEDWGARFQVTLLFPKERTRLGGKWYA